MSGDQDKSQKTEEPTQKRLDDAKKKGQVAKSQEVGHWFMMLGIAAVLMMVAGWTTGNLGASLKTFVASPHLIEVDKGRLAQHFGTLLGDVAVAMLPLFGVMFVLAAVGAMIQHPPLFAPQKIKPEFSKISPVTGLKRLFSTSSLMDFGKGIAKLCIVAAIVVTLILPELQKVPQLIGASQLAVLVFVQDSAVLMVSGVMAVMTIIAAADFVFQKWKTKQDLMMSKQEIKDEHKQQEGDPMIKARLRALRQERSRKRMMAAVPTADVVIANPTHYAVALKYDMESMEAPICVAKGIDAIALKIREIAEENNVAVMENPPLARALHASVEIDMEIPVDHYKAVAEVITFVMNMRRKFSRS